MSITVRRPLYSGSGYRLYNGAGLALSEEFESDSLEQAIYDLLTEVRAVVGGPGSTVIQAIEVLATIVQTVDSVVTLINGKVDDANAALGISLPALYPGLVDRIEDLRNATPHALPATSYNLGNIYQAIASPLTVGTLPNPAPSGYGGADASAIAAAVWAYTLYNWDAILGQYQGSAAGLLQHAGQSAAWRAAFEGAPDSRNPFFALVGTSAVYITDNGYYDWATAVAPVPLIDFSAVLPGDTILSFLQRELDDYTWTDQGPFSSSTPAGVYGRRANMAGSLYWRCLLSTEQLQLLAGNVGGTEISVAPVYPGPEGVVAGEPVEFEDVTVIDGPMHGILVEYTTPPAKTDKWTVGDYSNYGHAGQLAFVSSDGYAEAWQYLQWDKQVYVPRALSEAASVLLRPIAGQEGTVTPWTLL